MLRAYMDADFVRLGCGGLRRLAAAKDRSNGRTNFYSTSKPGSAIFTGRWQPRGIARIYQSCFPAAGPAGADEPRRADQRTFAATAPGPVVNHSRSRIGTRGKRGGFESRGLHSREFFADRYQNRMAHRAGKRGRVRLARRPRLAPQPALAVE